MIKERIEKIHDYFVGMEVMNGTMIVRVHYPERWGAYPSDDGLIKIVKADDGTDVCFYYADYDIVSFEQIFDLIDETILMNINAQKKIELLKEKVEELKQLFSDSPLEKLQGLYFGFSEPTTVLPDKPKKKKNNKKNKKDVVVEEPVTEPVKEEEIKENNNEEVYIISEKEIEAYG